MEFRRGNLLETDINIIAHGCNAQGVMGSGVAKQIRAKWHGAYDTYKIYCDHFATSSISPRMLGTNVYYTDHVNGKTIVNCITQEEFGAGIRQVNYAAILQCFQRIVGDFKSGRPDKNFKIAIPKIGAGLGGGSWEVIKTLLLDFEALHKVEFVVYEL